MCTPITMLNRAALKNFSLNSQSSRCLWSFTGNHVNKMTTSIYINQERNGSASTAISTGAVLPGVLTKKQAKELAVRLTSDERQVLISALQECQSQKLKAEYEGKTEFKLS